MRRFLVAAAAVVALSLALAFDGLSSGLDANGLVNAAMAPEAHILDAYWPNLGADLQMQLLPSCFAQVDHPTAGHSVNDHFDCDSQDVIRGVPEPVKRSGVLQCNPVFYRTDVVRDFPFMPNRLTVLYYVAGHGMSARVTAHLDQVRQETHARFQKQPLPSKYDDYSTIFYHDPAVATSAVDCGAYSIIRIEMHNRTRNLLTGRPGEWW